MYVVRMVYYLQYTNRLYMRFTLQVLLYVIGSALVRVCLLLQYVIVGMHIQGKVLLLGIGSCKQRVIYTPLVYVYSVS